MDILLKAIAGGFVALILGTVLPPDRKEVKLILGLIALCAIAVAAISYLRPVVVLIEQMKSLGKINDEMIDILWKSVGIGVISEISSTVCKDMGNGSLERIIQFAGMATILWMMVPLFHEFIKLIENILERL
jgi:stage III sporulation protein AD